jgi:phenazine biosynthesis protein phzE
LTWQRSCHRKLPWSVNADSKTKVLHSLKGRIMKNMIFNYIQEDKPFCVFQKENNVTLVQGHIQELNYLDEISEHSGSLAIRSISMIPYCQIKERGFKVLDGGEKILTLVPEDVKRIPKEEFLQYVSEDVTLEIDGDLHFNLPDQEYEDIVAQVIEHEIKNGEGSNFLISRKTQGRLRPAGIQTAFVILKRFIRNEFGAYMNFCFFDGEKCFIGASPERHLSISKGIAYLNPISGTMPKAPPDFKEALVAFLQDSKEIHELFQVVDEELKMMAKICKGGGDILGPFLKEMRTLVHTEYLLKGYTDICPIEAFRETMYAPTMIGSPLENACRIIYKYEKDPRRYYSSAMLILGEDDDGCKFMDSAITIRTMELDTEGNFTVQAGASIVRDSVPEKERIEVTTKSLGALKAIQEREEATPILESYLDPYMERIFQARNENLSRFWLEKQSRTFREESLVGKSVLIVDNEDNFSHMLAHMLGHLGLIVRVEKIARVPLDIHCINEDLIVLGAGPGDPENEKDGRIARLNMLTRRLLISNRKFMGICFGHQVICRNLGLHLAKLDTPLQGVQKEILLFGEKQIVGFYNTFVVVVEDFNHQGFHISVNEAEEVNAIKGPNFYSFQFHVESVLTRNGLDILKHALFDLLGNYKDLT